MVGMHGRNVARVLGTVCVGASLLAGGWTPAAVAGSTTTGSSIEPGRAPTSAVSYLRPSRNRPSPGYQFGLSKDEQVYIFGPRAFGIDGGKGGRGNRPT